MLPGAPKHAPDLREEILLYQVVPGEYLAADVLAEDSLPTVLGQSLHIEDEDVEANGIPLVATDIGADNRMIHAISGVLIPPQVAI